MKIERDLFFSRALAPHTRMTASIELATRKSDASHGCAALNMVMISAFNRGCPRQGVAQRRTLLRRETGSLTSLETSPLAPEQCARCRLESLRSAFSGADAPFIPRFGYAGVEN